MKKIIKDESEVQRKPLHPRATDFTKLDFLNCTPLYPILMPEQKASHWLCRCNCGNLFIVSADDLRRNKNINCGCILKNDITNQRFGRITALYATDKRDKKGNIIWHCKCDCGKELDVPSHRLLSGGMQSCGCQRIENIIKFNHTRAQDLTGRTFGKLTAIKPVGNTKDRKIVWLCQCDCGNTCEVPSADLISGNTKSCGCYKNRSYGEEKIATILRDNHIIFVRQKTFDGLVSENQVKLRFDFYLPDYNTLIEYDGQQHTIMGKGNYDNPDKIVKTQHYDDIKNQWCIDNNITLIRIPYLHYNQLDIQDLLPETSSFIFTTL